MYGPATLGRAGQGTREVSIGGTMCDSMSLPMEEQRRRGMEGRNQRLHPSSWMGRRVTRRISPYVTRVFLKLGVSANQCTVLRMLLTVGVGLAFTSPEPIVWVGAALLGYGAIVLDGVDGELARINGTSSPEGTYLESVSSQFAQPYLLACMAIGLFVGLGGTHVLVVGLGAVLGSSLAVAHTQMVRAVAWECSVQPCVRTSRSRRSSSRLVIARNAANVLLITPGLVYLPQVLVTSLVDAFAEGFGILGFAFNARLAWLTVFALGSLAAAVVRATVTVRQGIENEL